MSGFNAIVDGVDPDLVAQVNDDRSLSVKLITGGAQADVNLTQVAGVAVKTGAGTATGVIRVELPTNGTGFVGLNGGPTAADAALTANPVTIGGRAATTAPTPVQDGDVVNAQYSKTGKAVVIGALRTMKASQNTIITASTAETTIVTAGAAGVFNDLYGLILANTGASTTEVTIRDVASGSVIATFEVPTLETRGFWGPVDSGFSQTTAASAWTAQCTTSTSSLKVTAAYAVNS